MAINTEKYKKMFIREAQENLDILNNSLLRLEKKPDDKKSATELMRAAHTLKSSSAAMGYARMSRLTHAIEDIFDQVRSGKAIFSPENSDMVFSAFDIIDKSLQAIKAGRSELDTASAIERLASRKQESKKTRKQEKAGINDASDGVILAEKPETIRQLEEIKVDIKTLDTLMSLAEELLVNKMRLIEIATNRKYEELPVALYMLGRLVTDTQYNVMQARMVPLSQIFDRFPRMVRDLANKEKKEVEFEAEGGDIELDRTVIDKIGEPLVHLLRNAVDHGISDKGNVQLRAKREKSYVLIEVINQGRSIDWRAVVDAAVRKGIISKMKGDEYLKNIGNWKSEIENLLYHPELSTSAKITETSGRGIGLNIVKTRIESLGGAVSLESPIANQEGGTKFILQLPLTIAIIQALLVKVNQEIFAIPIANIDRSVKIQPDLIKKAFDREVAIVDKADIPLVRLDRLFGLKKNNQTISKIINQKSELAVIIKKTILLDTGEEEERSVFGLVVDSLVSEQEIVIKPLTGVLKQNKGFAGITILGDGRPALILDVSTLI